MSFHSRTDYLVEGRHKFRRLTLSTAAFPVSRSLSVHGLGIWRGALFHSDHRGYLVYYNLDLLKGINALPRIPEDCQE